MTDNHMARAVAAVQRELDSVNVELEHLTARRVDLERALRNLNGEAHPIERALSAESRAKISAAQKARWAKRKGKDIE